MKDSIDKGRSIGVSDKYRDTPMRDWQNGRMVHIAAEGSSLGLRGFPCEAMIGKKEKIDIREVMLEGVGENAVLEVRTLEKGQKEGK